MILVIQRVKEASVTIDKKEYSHINHGVLVLLGIEKEDGDSDIHFLSKKLVDLRMFADEAHRMNLSVKEIGGEILIVSQFTLPADCRKGRRPSFIKAAPPDLAKPVYNTFISSVESYGISVKTGKFAAMMDIHLVNDGPVTFILCSREGKPVEI